jgi:hypothetical protein
MLMVSLPMMYGRGVELVGEIERGDVWNKLEGVEP